MGILILGFDRLGRKCFSAMRTRSKRSFTVEIKAGGRQLGRIPSRAAPSVALQTASSPLLPVELPAVVMEPRRVLPNLIVLEVLEADPEPRPRRRGRPPKVLQEVIEPDAVPPQDVNSAPTFQAPAVLLTPAKRTAKSAATLAPGERWKRRLGRWSR